MDDSGNIRHFAEGEMIPSGFRPISATEANHLKGHAAKDRSAELKQMRKKAIRDAKRVIGRCLTTNELTEVLEAVTNGHYQRVRFLQGTSA